jgi:hypothetical protein
VPLGISSAPQLPRPRAAVAGLAGSLIVRAVLVALASALVAGAVATLTSAPSGAPSPAARLPEIRTIPAAERAAFGILRRDRVATDSFQPIRAGAGPSGANPALARHAALPSARLSPLVVSVVPANGGVCLRILLAADLASWRCQPTALAASGALRVVLGPVGPSPKGTPPTPSPGGEDFVVGLVPDGVTTVTITAAHGLTRTVAVRSNVYGARVHAPRAITFTLSGHRSISYSLRG